MVGVISALALGEHLTLLQGAGIAAILAGIWCVSLTDRATGGAS
jgi:drug/metabolite transporter (DMT)-like permease